MSPRQVLLGLVILFQLAFLLLSNTLSIVKTARDHLATDPISLPWLDPIATGLNHWAQFTGQEQDWRLFAPTVTRTPAFPVVILFFEDEMPDFVKLKHDARNGFHVDPNRISVRRFILHSDNEPADIQTFFRVGKSRLRRVENLLCVLPLGKTGETREQAAARMNENVGSLRHQYEELAIAYMKQRIKDRHSQHQDEPKPRQVVLGQRSFRVHDPEERVGWDGPFFVPLLRWNLADPEHHLDVFDFAVGKFKS